MSMWRDKSEAQLRSMLATGEMVIRRGDGTVGLKEAFFVLTNRRVFIFRLGTTVMSEPKMAEIDLRHIKSVFCEPGILTKGPTLVIEARSGTFDIILRRAARKEAGMWPKWILGAHGSLSPKARASDDVAARLAQLAELHSSGALTSSEFAKAKSKLLGSG
jgi:hypothetical protein